MKVIKTRHGKRTTTKTLVNAEINTVLAGGDTVVILLENKNTGYEKFESVKIKMTEKECLELINKLQEETKG